MTYFLHDVLRQPDELQRVIQYFYVEGRPALEDAVAVVRSASHVYVTGIGSSWHAALNAKSLFHEGGLPVHSQDASELLHFDSLPAQSVIIAISRTGRSAEIARLLPKARSSGAAVIGITNSADGPLAQEAEIPIIVPVGFDHAISVNTYSTLSAAAGALATAALGSFDASLVDALDRAVGEAAQALPGWQEQIADSRWPASRPVCYFLARGPSLGSCHEARLLWEEGVKLPATALGTGGFRHGSQEIIARNMRFALWIDGRRMRDQDLAVARDLRHLGAFVMLIGQDLPGDAGDLVFQLPIVPPEWQFLIDIMPMQLMADHMARLSGGDCDSFRICSYIVEDEYGLLRDQQTRGV
ncbi:MAG TPA: SIS domain-containing protein [Terriglobia bacterium]|nr:SIS domain-containing protein [Terriglobia bacterium]